MVYKIRGFGLQDGQPSRIERRESERVPSASVSISEGRVAKKSRCQWKG